MTILNTLVNLRGGNFISGFYCIHNSSFREEALASVASVEMLPMPAISDGDGDDGPAYLVGGGSGSTDVAEQFFRRLKHHWNQGYTFEFCRLLTETGTRSLGTRSLGTRCPIWSENWVGLTFGSSWELFMQFNRSLRHQGTLSCEL